MKLRYSFDPEKWYLGTPCRRGHRWLGTGLSLRRNYKGSAACAGCTTDPESELPWLFRFIDLDASGVPAGHRLGKLCSEGHSWNDTGYTLRKHSHCIECERLRPFTEADRLRHKRYYEQNAELLRQNASERQRKRRLLNREGENAKAAAYKRQARADGRMPSRSSHGLSYRFLEDNGFSNGQAAVVAALLSDGWDVAQIRQQVALDSALRCIRPSPSVARLVHEQQLERWRQHPDERRKHASQWSAYSYAFRYKCDPAFRRHECQRNSERKAKNRGNHTVRLGSKATAARFAQFDNSCAYCGSTAHLIVEHFIPRAKGGPHALGNILPACQRCNVSKRDHDPEQWYRQQPFYTNGRWCKILAALGKAQGPVQQLPLL